MSATVLDDPLSSLAPLLRVRPVLDDLCRFGGVWDSPHDAEGPGWAHFHIVTRGECLLERVGQGPLPLKAGDVLLLPHGDPHVVRARRGSFGSHAGVTTEYRNAIRSRTSIGIPPDTELICGRLHFDTAPESLLIAALPDIIVLRPTDWPDAERMRFMLESVRDELDSDRAGAAAIATDLASALFMMMLRAHLEMSETSEGLLRLLRHVLPHAPCWRCFASPRGIGRSMSSPLARRPPARRLSGLSAPRSDALRSPFSRISGSGLRVSNCCGERLR
jgi:AraC family transcriptional regulator, activator of mtrCDE